MVLSQLEIKGLTRALSVSKYWRQTILGTIELRRDLFLAPKEKADEFLQWKQAWLEWEPFIVHEPTSSSKPIVKVHPILSPKPATRTNLDTFQPHPWLRMVSPSTFLTQPPVTEVKIEQKAFSIAYTDSHTHKFVLKRAQGVTFGDVVQEMGARHAREPSSEGVPDEENFGPNDKIQDEQRCTRIEAYGVVADASNWVRVARERLEQERQGSEECQS